MLGFGHLCYQLDLAKVGGVLRYALPVAPETLSQRVHIYMYVVTLQLNITKIPKFRFPDKVMNMIPQITDQKYFT